MKTYVITLSDYFPATHKKGGEPTYFRPKFLRNWGIMPGNWLKIHTIRGNYDLWRKRFEKIEAGEAVLSVRQWTGTPYCSKQFVLKDLTRDDGIGIQKLQFGADRDGMHSFNQIDIDGHHVNKEALALNDGLSLEEWIEWFRRYNLSHPLALIHFTPYRY